MARIRARHETVNRRLKMFGCLQQRYRHNIEDHATTMVAVVNIVNMKLKKDGMMSIW